MPLCVNDVTALFDQWYDPAWAETWDAVGLVCGDPGQPVAKVLLAVDPAPAVVAEARSWGADLLVCHHPLLLSPVHGIAATTPKGRVLHDLVGAGTALLTAHTNADVPTGGVNDALARAVGIIDPQVVLAEPERLDKLVVFVPASHADAVRTAITRAGAGTIGDYDSCTFSTAGEGRFRPLEGARPAVGSVGRLEVVEEVRIESVLPRRLRRQVVDAMRQAHPYEEVAYDVLELAAVPGEPAARGHGRIGPLAAPMTLRAFADQVADALPRTAHGVRVAGDPHRTVEAVVVGSGSGDFMLDTVLATDADVYVTSDLRHHRASEFLEHKGPALVDVAHWAAEWTWLPVVEQKLLDAARQRGDTVETRVSRVVTDRSTPLKADAFTQLKLLDVQQLDSALDQLRHRLANLAETKELAALNAEREDVDGRARDAAIRIDDLIKEQRKADADVEQVRSRRARDQDRMDRGLVTNPKDLEHMQQELVSLNRRISDLEDTELEVMERLEGVQAEQVGLVTRLADLDARIAEVTERRDARAGAAAQEAARTAEERKVTASGLPEDLLGLYERIRAQKGGVGAAALRQRRCDGCSLELTAADLGAIAKAPPDEVLRCEQCNRILVRTPESGL
jgi:dinuclear metal center YbgI/SA1388 family protein